MLRCGVTADIRAPIILPGAAAPPTRNGAAGLQAFPGVGVDNPVLLAAPGEEKTGRLRSGFLRSLTDLTGHRLHGANQTDQVRLFTLRRACASV